MKLTIPKCPACGEPACGIDETMASTAKLSFQDGTGEFEVLESVPAFDRTQFVTDSQGSLHVRCRNLHEWWSTRLRYRARLVLSSGKEIVREYAELIDAKAVCNRVALRDSEVGSLLGKNTGHFSGFYIDDVVGDVQYKIRDFDEHFGLTWTEPEDQSMPWCEPCGSYHHATAPHIKREGEDA